MKYIFSIAIILSISTLLLSAVAVYDTNDRSDFLETRASLVIRKIGHFLLLHAGDSSSRVLPIKQLDEATFQLTFQSSFSFMPDSLVSIVRSHLAKHNLPADYVVQVVESVSQDVVYGFAIGTDQADIVPCKGRVQPRGHYTIQIAFTDFDASDRSAKPYFLFVLALASLGTVAFVGKAWAKQQGPSRAPKNQPTIFVGSYQFDEEQGVLNNDTETITLSAKETKLLRIFAAEPNRLIERDRLLKEVWEDEGVFTGRSLDVFISKLRKKLKNDSSLRLTNVHGKGYILEINN
ncbi:MAG: helix-turn-helix domain-containing protein [Bacteroidota bacterium]